ncbi:MAG: formaldehyde-activating enzyme [Candidatus Methylarchaceae archaeon HK01B]|nr:formaldehyde-activating enzyme [Candidatus Methylarchaceae archaeon HK01B]
MFLVGECLAGEGNEVAHIDLMIGDKEGPVGSAFAITLAQPTIGHTPLLAVIAPNLMPKPVTVIVPKVDIKRMDQVVQIFGSAQAAVAKAVADSLAEGVISKDIAEDICIVCGVFIHPDAKDNKKIYEYNYEATKTAIERAFAKEPSPDKVIEKKDTVKHPFIGF